LVSETQDDKKDQPFSESFKVEPSLVNKTKIHLFTVIKPIILKIESLQTTTRDKILITDLQFLNFDGFILKSIRS